MTYQLDPTRPNPTQFRWFGTKSVALRLLPVALLLAACVSGRAAVDQPVVTQAYDLILRGGTVYTGTGEEPFVADVAIHGDRIAAIGDLRQARATRVVDVQGLAVAPGFINAHSWATGSLIKDPRGLSDLMQGVTTEVFGEGITMGPLNAELKHRLETEYDPDFPPPGYPITWSTLHEYLQHLQDKGVTPNVASLVGATTLRQYVVGDENRPPTPAELERMRELTEHEMRMGALGVGSRLAYAPASYASTEELIALAEVASKYGGQYMSHIRSEGNTLLEAVNEFLRVADEAEIGATIYHLKAAGAENWPKMDSVLAAVDEARARGKDITATVYPYRAGSTGLDASIPHWAHEGGPEALRARLRDSEARRRIAEDIRSRTTDWENYYRLSGSPENIVLVEFQQDSMKKYTGMTLARVAELRKADPVETLMDLVLHDESLVQTVYFMMSEENLQEQIRRPWVMLGSDAPSIAAEGDFLQSSVHPRAYGTFARFLGEYVREKRLIPLEEAIRRITSMPADHLSLTDRGRLQESKFADVVVFDPQAIDDRATFDDPHQYAAGVAHVFINGIQVLREGRHTGAFPGRALWGPGREPR